MKNFCLGFGCGYGLYNPSPIYLQWIDIKNHRREEITRTEQNFPRLRLTNHKPKLSE